MYGKTPSTKELRAKAGAVYERETVPPEGSAKADTKGGPKRSQKQAGQAPVAPQPPAASKPRSGKG